MDYWTHGYNTRSSKGLSIGTNHQLFSSTLTRPMNSQEESKVAAATPIPEDPPSDDGASKDDPVQEDDIKEREQNATEEIGKESEISPPSAKKARVDTEEDKKNEEDQGDKTSRPSSPEPHPKSDGDGEAGGKKESSDGAEQQQGTSEQKDEQESSPSKLQLDSGDQGP